jgi:hypothetical protein
MSDKNGESPHSEPQKAKNEEHKNTFIRPGPTQDTETRRNIMLDSPYSIYMSQDSSMNNPLKMPPQDFNQQNFGSYSSPQYQQFPQQQMYPPQQYPQQSKLSILFYKQ